MPIQAEHFRVRPFWAENLQDYYLNKNHLEERAEAGGDDGPVLGVGGVGGEEVEAKGGVAWVGVKGEQGTEEVTEFFVLQD